MTERKLRAVGPDEKPPSKPVVKEKIEEALDGSSRDVLASMRQALARKIDKGEIASNSIASAYRELRELDSLIRRIDDEARVEEAKRNADSDRERRSFNPEAI